MKKLFLFNIFIISLLPIVLGAADIEDTEEFSHITKITWRNTQDEQLVSFGATVNTSGDCANSEKVITAHHNRTTKIYFTDIRDNGNVVTMSEDADKKVYTNLKRKEQEQHLQGKNIKKAISKAQEK